MREAPTLHNITSYSLHENFILIKLAATIFGLTTAKPTEKMQKFRIAKMATLTSSSFFTETNHLKLLLRKK